MDKKFSPERPEKSEKQNGDFIDVDDDEDFFIEQKSDDAIIEDIKKWILRPIETWKIEDDRNPMIPDEEFEFTSETGSIQATKLFIKAAKKNLILSRSYIFDLTLLINKQNPSVNNFKNAMKNYIESKCKKWYMKKNANYFKLIGEFAFHKIITTDFLHDCINDLLNSHSNNDIKCLIKLMKNCGYSSRLQLEYYIGYFNKIIQENKLDSSLMEKFKKLYINVERIFLSCEQIKLKFMQDFNKQNSTEYLMNSSSPNKPETENLDSIRQFCQRSGNYSIPEDHTYAVDDYYIIKNIEVYFLNPIECYLYDDEFENEITDDEYEFQTKITTEIVTKLFLDRGKKNDLHSRSYAMELFYLMNKQKSFNYRDIMQDYVEKQCNIWCDERVPNDYCFIGELWFYRILNNEFIRKCIKLLIHTARECDIECLIRLIKGSGYSVALKINDHKERLNEISKNNNYSNDIRLKLDKLISRFSD